MADYFTHFSCLFDVGSAENVETALTLYARMEADLLADDDVCLSFTAVVSTNHPTALWLYDDAGGQPEYVVAFVLSCAEALGLSGRWGFVWAHTCSRARLDGFGGGAVVLDLGTRRGRHWLDCSQWLDDQLAAGTPREES